MSYDLTVDSNTPKHKTEEPPPACNPWKICAQVIGGVVVIAFLGLALMTALQAAGAISLSDSWEWIILAAEGNPFELLELVATTIGGVAVGILLIAFGTMKQSNDLPTYKSHAEYVEKNMPPNHFWYDPNHQANEGFISIYVSDAKGIVSFVTKTLEEFADYKSAEPRPAWFSESPDADMLRIDKEWIDGLPMGESAETYARLPAYEYVTIAQGNTMLFIMNESRSVEEAPKLVHQTLKYGSPDSLGNRFEEYLYTQMHLAWKTM